MTPNTVPSIPSREAVEAECKELDKWTKRMGIGPSKTAVMLRDLLAAVERLTQDRNTHSDARLVVIEQRDILRTERDELRATVVAQAADAARYRWLKSVDPYALCEIAWRVKGSTALVTPDEAIDAVLALQHDEINAG